MISKIEALNYCCFRFCSQPLAAFNVLFGSNGSGKTVFLDVLAFLKRLVSEDPESAVYARADDFQDLTWRRNQNRFELAVEAFIPDDILILLNDASVDRFRYQVSLGISAGTEIAILAERGFLMQAGTPAEHQQTLFPENRIVPQTILLSPKGDRRTIFNKKHGGNDNYYSEVRKKDGSGWRPSFKLGPRKSSLGNLPEEASLFPVSTWFKNLLAHEIKKVTLGDRLLSKPCAPGESRVLKPNGSNLPLVIEHLQTTHPGHFQKWILALQAALPEIKTIRIKEQTDDRKRYLIVVYKNGLEIPSWMVSKGTLRLMALTLFAFVCAPQGIYIFENPESAIFPGSINTILKALTSVCAAQLFLSTHSRAILEAVSPQCLLCFTKNGEGHTDIMRGDQHPAYDPDHPRWV